jgi:hypothetical protein
MDTCTSCLRMCAFSPHRVYPTHHDERLPVRPTSPHSSGVLAKTWDPELLHTLAGLSFSRRRASRLLVTTADPRAYE